MKSGKCGRWVKTAANCRWEKGDKHKGSSCEISIKVIKVSAASFQAEKCVMCYRRKKDSNRLFSLPYKL